MNAKFDVAGHIYILLTLIFTVYGQLVLKWQMGHAGPMPEPVSDKLLFLFQQFLKPWILSGLVAAFLASLAWMAAMTRLDLNYAYPFMSLAFIIVLGFAIIFLDEPLSAQRVFGTLLVVSGLITMTR